MKRVFFRFGLILAAGAFSLPGLSKADEIQSSVIYDQDSRTEIHQVEDPLFRELAKSSVALVQTKSLTPYGNDAFLLSGPKYGAYRNLCSEERFVEQETPAFCSGVLIAPDLVLTAGHCFETPEDCQQTKLLFGYALDAQGLFPRIFPAREIYGCRKVLGHPTDTLDFVFVLLDRPVPNHPPVALKTQEAPSRGDLVATLGFPGGTPLKMASGRVREIKKSWLETTIDDYEGNSGGPVFNIRTGALLGIVLGGEDDYELDKKRGCYVSKHCSEKRCSGEDILRVEEILRSPPEEARTLIH